MFCFFFFAYLASTEIYTLSLHDALPILRDFYVSANLYYEFGRKVFDGWASYMRSDGQYIGAFGQYARQADRWQQPGDRSEEHTSELQSRGHLVCRLLLEKKKKSKKTEQDERRQHRTAS